MAYETIRYYFEKARTLYPNVAKGGLHVGYEGLAEEFNEYSCPSNSYGKETNFVLIVTDNVASLLHELGHAYAHIYYPSHLRDELLAWDTAKSLALEIGYEWTEADDAHMVHCLRSYGLTPEGLNLIHPFWQMKEGVVCLDDFDNGYAVAVKLPYTITNDGIEVNDFYSYEYDDIMALNNAGWWQAYPLPN
jgi:hypothetical protein